MDGSGGDGWPKFTACDRGVHNRGVSSNTVRQEGVRLRPAGLEYPEQIGRVERRGDMLKNTMSKVINETHANGKEAMDMVLTECLNSTNEMSRHGGFHQFSG